MKKIFIAIALSIIIIFFSLVGLFYWFVKPWNRALFIKPVYRMDTQEKIVALTFDDGPSPTRTLPVLEVLHKHQVKASFFMIGQAIEAHPDIAQAVVAQGHMVGNHSYSHQRLLFKSPQFVTDEITKTTTLLQSIGSSDYRYFRPPYGKKFIIVPLVLQSLNMTLVTGTFDPTFQYEIPFPEEKVVNQILAQVKPGSIIFLHDGRDDNPEGFAKAVDTIITTLKAQGYRFVTIKEGIELGQ